MSKRRPRANSTILNRRILVYRSHFAFRDPPFSISPDPRYLYLSEGHREAFAHLLYGAEQSGGFVQLTGEVGTGKTTLCRCLLEQLPAHVDVALVLNPRLTDIELLATICDELHVAYPDSTTSLKELIDALYTCLLDARLRGRQTLLIIDEAQNLAPDVLEQIRLLTNLETTTEKLLQIILIGQPELVSLLDRAELRQLAQRITARYHLRPFSQRDVHGYIAHRLAVAGCTDPIFSRSAIREVYRFSKGVPRLINAICDRALLGAYIGNRKKVNPRIVRAAAKEIEGRDGGAGRVSLSFMWVSATTLTAGMAFAAIMLLYPLNMESLTSPYRAVLPSPAMGSDVAVPAARQLPAAGSDDAMEQEAAARTAADIRAAAPRPNHPIDEANGVAAGMSSPDTAEAGATPSATGDSHRDKMAFADGGALPQDDDGRAANIARLADVLNDPAIPSDQASTIARLLSLWHVSSDDTTCNDALQHGMECDVKAGTWNNLRQFNVPAVVELVAGDGVARYAVVTAIEDQNATLLVGDRSQTYPISEIDSVWYGRYMVLWKRPPLTSTTIGLGARGKDVIWLRDRLSALDGSIVRAKDDELYDEELKQRVIAFQRSRSINPDGIVGRETLTHLSMAAPDPENPVLVRARP